MIRYQHSRPGLYNIMTTMSATSRDYLAFESLVYCLMGGRVGFFQLPGGPPLHVALILRSQLIILEKVMGLARAP